MSLHKVIKLFTKTITVPYEVVQMVLSVAPIFVEATADNLPKREVMGSGDEEGLQEASQTMLQCVQGLRGHLVPSPSHV